MAAKKKGPGKGRGPSSRPASPAKRTTVAKPAAPKPPTAGTPSGAPKPAATTPKPAATTPKLAPAKASTAPQPAAAPKAPAAKVSIAPQPAAAPKPVAPQPAAASKPPAAKVATAPKAPAVAKAAGAAKSAGAAVGKSTSTPKKGGSSKQATKGVTRTTPTREERLAAAEAARRRQRTRNRALVAGGVALVVLVVGFVIISDRRERSRQAAEFTTASCRFDRTSDPDDGPGRNHIATPTYRVNPPAGGNHTPQAAPAGVYTDANLPSDGQIVHAMEHGYIVLWYRPDLGEESLGQLRDLANQHARDVLMVPRPSIDTPVAATAWHARVLCGGLEVDTLEKFIVDFVNKGPEKVAH